VGKAGNLTQRLLCQIFSRQIGQGLRHKLSRLNDL
jgi:hypothetical protein